MNRARAGLCAGVLGMADIALLLDHGPNSGSLNAARALLDDRGSVTRRLVRSLPRTLVQLKVEHTCDDIRSAIEQDDVAGVSRNNTTRWRRKLAGTTNRLAA